MKPIATPIIGGMVTSTIHVLVITPVIFYIMKRRALRQGRLVVSAMNVQSRKWRTRGSAVADGEASRWGHQGSR